MLKITYITCAECGAEVDAVEADDAGPAKAVQDVMAALDMSETEARKLVAKRNPGAELSSVESQGQLVERVLAKDVKDRPAETYVCPNGHDGELTASDQRPAPPASLVVRTPVSPETADQPEKK